jgi:hypothetical protein
MVLFRRNRVPVGAYFSTLMLAKRSARTLVEQINALRWSLWQIRRFRAEVPALAGGENRATGSGRDRRQWRMTPSADAFYEKFASDRYRDQCEPRLA